MKVKKKLRIQTFDDEGYQINDRLVEQDIELNTGPKDIHKGPMRIEVNLFEKDDVEKFTTYLQKLVGDLPIDAPGKDKPKKVGMKTILTPEHREGVINQASEMLNQDQVIDFLRSAGFEFLTFDYITSLGLNTGIEEKHQEKYQWMLKLVKRAKNPLNNKYDPTLCFGFKLVGTKIDTFVVYLYAEKHKIIRKEWVNKQKVSFKNTEMIKFPPYMVQEEKDKFRIELDTLRRFEERQPSKFFMRWIQDVEFKDKPEINKRIND